MNKEVILTEISDNAPDCVVPPVVHVHAFLTENWMFPVFVHVELPATDVVLRPPN